jgi:hypothetical protein
MPAMLNSLETFSGTHFYYTLSKPQGYNAAAVIMLNEKIQ